MGKGEVSKMNQGNEKRKPVRMMLTLLVYLTLISLILSSIINIDIKTGNVAVVKINGPIIYQDAGFASSITSTPEILKILDDIELNPNVKAILVEINSPGGSPVGSNEIQKKLVEMRDNYTIVSLIHEVGASGAYWISTASERAYADELSLIGSIGVTASQLGFEEFIKEHNISYRRYVSGEYKDMGTPFREPKQEENAILQKITDEMYEVFIKSVAENRNMTEKDVTKLATGEVYLAREAIEKGLIDEIGNKKEAIDYIEKQENITVKIDEYQKKATFFERFSSIITKIPYSVGYGMGSALNNDMRKSLSFET